MNNETISGKISSSTKILGGKINTESQLSGKVQSKGSMIGNIMETVLVGLSAYEVAVKNGFEGTEEEWLQSLVGDSVKVEVVSNTRNEYILSFQVGEDTPIITPNLKPILEKGVDYMTPEDIAEITEDVIFLTEDVYQPIGNYVEGDILTISELNDLLK